MEKSTKDNDASGDSPKTKAASPQPGTSSPPEADATRPTEDDEAALRERREQRWDSEGGAAPASPRSG